MSLPRTLRAAVLEQTGAPLQMADDIEIPPLAAGQVLVQIHYAGVCHSQLMEVRGKRGEDRFLPHLLGHEATATVLAVGEQVRKVAPGERVVLGWIKGGGIEAGGVRYRQGERVINAGAVATFATYAVVSENRCVVLPPSVPADLGVLLGCAVPTGAGMVLNTLAPTAGQSLAVVGLGGIGLAALMAACAIPGLNIAAIDPEANKRELARRIGAQHVFDPTAADFRERWQAAFPGGVDHCIEAAGRAETIELGFSLVRRGGGRCLFASHPANGEAIRIDPYELICGKRLEGS
ncbi:MAG TPA: zinc-binding dehydrogenase, partial [Azonexus sp.]|nr:zinc-binding dehydrogenase [Azonexus sp.]